LSSRSKRSKKSIFRVADQPANRTPYTPTEEIASVYRIPSEKSDSVRPAPNGITPHPSRLKISVITGARKNRLFVACAGITVSLTTSFKASATIIYRHDGVFMTYYLDY